MSSKAIRPWLLALTLLPGCRDPLPCPDCTDEVAEDSPEDAEPLPDLPDLPCGGADLETDNDNCGSCGNECDISYEGKDWEAGTCVDGKCGPLWSQCNDYSLSDESCAEVCAGLGRTCVAQGCSGMTAMLFYVGFDGECNLFDSGPQGFMDGPCDEPIPWESTIEWDLFAMCCCE